MSVRPFYSSQIILSRRCLALSAILACFFFLFQTEPIHAQPGSCKITWENPLRLSFDSVLSTTPQISVSGDTVHVLWFGIDTIGNVSHAGIEYARSTDRGRSFSPQITILSPSIALNTGLVASSGAAIYVAFTGFLNGSFGTALLRSSDAGLTWEPARLLLNNVFPQFIVASDSDAYIHYVDQSHQRHGFLRSGSYGERWEVLRGFVPPLTDMCILRNQLHGVASEPGSLHDEVTYYGSVNRGDSWFGSEILSRDDVTPSILPQIAVNEQGTIYISWNDSGTIVMRRSDGIDADDNLLWQSQITLSEERGAIFSDLAAGRSFVSSVWDNDFGSTRGLRIRPSNDEALSFCDIDTPAASGLSSEPSMTIAANMLHLTWSDQIGGNTEIMYRQGKLTEDIRPKSFVLRQNFPNPFNGTTTIRYDLPTPSTLTLTIYNILGQRVATLVDGAQEARRYEYSFAANGLPSGVYFYRIKGLGFAETKKMIILR